LPQKLGGHPPHPAGLVKVLVDAADHRQQLSGFALLLVALVGLAAGPRVVGQARHACGRTNGREITVSDDLEAPDGPAWTPAQTPATPTATSTPLGLLRRGDID
jgi:hypothetical protein